MSRAHTLTVEVTRVIAETPAAKSIVFKVIAPLDEEVRYQAGQFVTLKIPVDGGGHCARCYSLSTCPSLDEELAITVKRNIGGYASNWLCDNAVTGLQLEIRHPSGTFVCHDYDSDLLLFAAGSGITPVMSILREALARGTAHAWLFYANQDENSVIFRDHLRQLEKDHADRFGAIQWLESVQGLPTAGIIRMLGMRWPAAEAYLCGPTPFMDVVSVGLRDAGVPARRVHREKYLSLTSDPFEVADLSTVAARGSNQVEVFLEGVTSTVSWPPGSVLLDALLGSGLDAPFSCREGRCSACACRLLAGQVAMDANHILDDSDLERGLILACQARALTPVVQITYDDV